MKKLEVCSIALFLVLLLVPATMTAQDTTPPRCCPRTTGIIEPIEEESGPLLQAEFTISDSMLKSHYLSRLQVIEWLAESLFPGKNVEVIVSSRIPLDAPILDTVIETDTLSLMAVETTYFYRLSISAISAEDIDQLDQVGLTDGATYINIIFAGTEP